MKAILEFDLSDPDDRDEHRAAINGSAMQCVLWEFIHNYGRFVEYTDKQDELLSEIKNHLREELERFGVLLD